MLKKKHVYILYIYIYPYESNSFRRRYATKSYSEDCIRRHLADLSLSLCMYMYIYKYMFYIWAHYYTPPKSNGLNILFRIQNAKHWANPPPFRTQKESISSWVVIYIYPIISP